MKNTSVLRKLCFWTVALPLWIVSPALNGQASSEPQWDNLAQLQAGQKIQVVEANLKAHKGVFLSFSENAVSVRVRGEGVEVARANVLRISSLDRSKRRRNTVLGLAIGVGAGMLAGGGIAAALGLFDEGTGSKPAAIILGLGGAGAAAGYIAGASSGYRTIYRKQSK